MTANNDSEARRPVPENEYSIFEHHEVIIIGAGPTGLFTALRIAQADVDVCVMEAEPGIVNSPRATTYMPIVCNEFEKAGIYEDVIARGHKNTEGISFRTSFAKGDKVLARLQMSQVPKGQHKYDFAGIHMGQHELAKIILEHCNEHPQNFSVKWRHRFAGAKNRDDGKIELVTLTDRGEKWFTCDYLIGCDGAGSSVRRSQCIQFDGFTWQDFRFIASNVQYDFEQFEGWTTANMIVDENNWAVIARTGKPEEGIWRVAYGIDGKIPDAEATKSLPEKYESLLPGPRPLKYKVVNANPYWAHQRCASKFRNGNIILCGDAAHSNNPIGGLGLTSGLLDSSAISNCLIRILRGKEKDADALIHRYCQVRRDSFLKFTNPQSIDFKLRVHSMDPKTTEERDFFFDKLNNDPEFVNAIASSMNEFMDDGFEIPADSVVSDNIN
ncbi:hypothetical protein LTR99_010643 [Exophiala xenobiotica]|uniref:FAD-binding domain-containing protein n=1 Tax=Vermiconidia calcicola TaxID=1690605 RepID=A0AAV9Q685_9PEZI|nr:hypothetical protein H2202_008777 [Exophiala xenobiotica]KAK5533854.1 hypothetical protein LTR25_006834 [Vermiconidia calcicola]KAK5546405.1 hypothetical protein LTR23_003510 [Chaetothyriales sp. CCFEE 6169]KAK5192988.1 hypothetical protein LTR92_007282 [Exophiala xenobiotica]KAK5212284.1 hypothetical protein LTR41_002526 [Exophiala xenobiotica]